MPDRMLTAVEHLTTQVRRIADTLTIPTRRPADEPLRTDDDDRITCHTCHVTGVFPGRPLHSWYCPDRPLSAPPVDDQPAASHVKFIAPHVHVTNERLKDEQAMTAHLGQPAAQHDEQPSAATEEELRNVRRPRTENLLARLDRRGILAPGECATLRAHVEAEMREADTARRSGAQAEDLLRIAHETSNRSEAERTRQHDRAEQAIRRACEEYDRRQAVEQRLDQAEVAVDRARGVLTYVESPLAQSGPAVSTHAVRGIAERLGATVDGAEQAATEQNLGGCCDCPHEMEI